ncbi:MAG: NERD domain-containing protein [Albidovulum sp.]|nr:NERD domain-containing protein [Albidovulum sp.]
MSEFIVTHVQPGETLSGIAARYGVSVDSLQRWNSIEDPDLVLVGQRIVVYNAADAAGSIVSGSAESRASSDSLIANDSQDIAVGGTIALGLLLLLLLLRRKRRGATPIPRAPSLRQPQQPVSRRGTPVAKGQDSTFDWPTSASDPLPKPQVNDGERLVRGELRRRYHDWILIDNVMVPSGQGTTQIDHILISPRAVFLIETKDMNGWVFGRPGDKQWTQSYKAGHRSRKAGIKSKQFKFYNPLWQNEGHAKSLVRLGVVDRWRDLRPVVLFVGDSELKTAGKFLPFDEHEEIASQNRTWRMRGVVCMSLEELNRYIEFSINASSNSGLTRQQMESICDKIGTNEIPMTDESHAKHVDFVQSVKELNSQ